MRWGELEIGEIGESREISKFLFLPKCIEGEWRWWEMAKYKQKYRYVCLIKRWVDIKWLNR